MSILNLNTPQGRGPVGKKSAKIWMGVGLLAAVLGFGSTFAANITLNSPGGTTEFGQGVSQTVYCGGNKSVTITPISAYQNSIKSDDTQAVETLTANVRVLSTSGRTEVSVSTSLRVTISSRSSSSVPRWGSALSDNTISGYWITTPTSDSASAIAATNDQIVTGAVYFAPEYTSGKYKKVSNSSDSNLKQVVLRQGTPFVAGAVTSPASFKVAGVLISSIPVECANVDFVVSAYSETGTAQTLISGSGTSVKEVAAQWTGSGTVDVSRDRNSAVSTSLVTGEQSGTSLKFIFNISGGSPLAAPDLYKLIVETQEDVLAN